eukprot:scaffold2072_cov126-Isochrysis_galbana.AAC.1
MSHRASQRRRHRHGPAHEMIRWRAVSTLCRQRAVFGGLMLAAGAERTSSEERLKMKTAALCFICQRCARKWRAHATRQPLQPPCTRIRNLVGPVWRQTEV